MTKLVYFAWVREKIGLADEEIDLPDDVSTVADLLDHLASRGGGYAEALEHRRAVRVAIDQEHVGHDETLGRPAEIALFPPMTGG